MNQMLATAEADFQPDRIVIAEMRPQIDPRAARVLLKADALRVSAPRSSERYSFWLARIVLPLSRP